MNTYLAVDAEFAWDEHLFEAHRQIDRKSNRHATAVKRVIAASALQFSVDDEGRVSAGTLASWTEFDWGSEEAVVSQLFDHLRALFDHVRRFKPKASRSDSVEMFLVASGFRGDGAA